LEVCCSHNNYSRICILELFVVSKLTHTGSYQQQLAHLVDLCLFVNFFLVMNIVDILLTIYLNINHFVSAGTKASHYDPNHRNPLYCNADNECIWELKQLVNHFHPTVSLFASKLVKVMWLHHTATVVKARIQMNLCN
jgi:hypothetical protein